MSSLSQKTPRGTYDFLPAEAEALRALEAKIRRLWHRFGYREVITPTFELYESLMLGANEEQRERMFRFFDREGEILALRSDVTTPIARLVATRLNSSPRPIRLFYVAPVFRWLEDGAGRQREFRQAGVELIGAPGPEADAEVVLLAALALESAGLPGFRIDLGQVNFFQAVLDESGLSPSAEAAVRDAFLRKDWVGLRRTVAQVGENGRESILALTEMRGGTETVAKARRLVSGKAGQAALDNLQAVVDILTEFGISDQVQVDLGLVKDLSYYTGMVLEGYAPSLGYTLCTGGRYDQLHTQFGQDNPATGFALGLTRLTTALGETAAELVAEEPRISVGADTGCRREALTAVQSLQCRGVAVEWDLPESVSSDVSSREGRSGSCQASLKFFRRDGEVWFRFLKVDAQLDLESPLSEFSRVSAALDA